MRTLFTAIFLLLVSCFSFAQTITRAEGFFDTDPGVGNGFAVTITPNGSVTIISNSSAISQTNGVHTLYIRTRASTKLWSVSEGLLVHVTPSTYASPIIQQIVKAEFWVGADPGVGNGTNAPITTNAGLASFLQNYLSTQTPGFYLLGVRFKTSAGLWSDASYRSFYVRSSGDNAMAQQIVKAEYYIGNDPGAGNGNNISLTSGDPVAFTRSFISNQPPGVYALSIRTKSNVGLWSDAHTEYYYVSPASAFAIANQITEAEYFVDADPGLGNGTAITITPGDPISISGQALASMSEGTHILYLRTKSDKGLWSVSDARAFIIAQGPLGPVVHNVIAAEYFINSDPGQGNGTPFTIVPAPTVNLLDVVDVSTLVPGQYTLGIRFKSEDNLWSDVSLQTFVITAVIPPSFLVNTVDPLCAGSNNGSISVGVNNGNPPFTYQWNGTMGDAFLQNVVAGTYQLQVLDATNVQVLDTAIVVSEPAAIIYQSTTTDVSCFGGTDGTAILTIDGGTGDLSVDWVGANPNALGGGVHAFTISDENNCVVNGSVNIAQPSALFAQSTVTPVTTAGQCNGDIALNIDGGTAPYNVVWSAAFTPGQVCEGSYTATVTDANGCVLNAQAALVGVGIVELASFAEVVVSPNPSAGVFNLHISTSQTAPLSWTVYDVSGRIVMRNTAHMAISGATDFKLDLTAFGKGLYTLEMQLGTEHLSKKLLLMND